MDEFPKCRVLKSHDGKDGNELTLKVGDIVTVLRKGRYIWYGQLENVKGFFPIENVEVMNELTSTDKPGSPPVSSTAVVDKGKEQNSLAQADTKMSSEAFKEMGEHSPLEDKRRTRVRSTGRPPSQVFMKENMLQRSESTTDVLETDSDDDQAYERNDKPDPVSTKITSISQLVQELKQKPHTKTVIQKDTTTTTTTTTSTETSAEPPAWMKALTRKKSTPNVANKPEPGDNTPPWMKEIIRRREHKLSLRGDELNQKTEDNRTYQGSTAKQAKVEIQSFETRSTNQAVTDETFTIQAKSVNLDSFELNSNKTNVTISSSKAMQSYSLTNGNSDVTVSTTIKKGEVTTNSMDVPVGKQMAELVATVNTINSNSTEIAKMDTSASNANVSSDLKEPLNKEKGDNATNSKTSTEINIQIIKEAVQDDPIIYATPPTSPATRLNLQKQISVDKTEKKDTKGMVSTELPVKKSKQKDINSIKQVLEKLDNFQIKSNANITQIEKEIKNLQLLLNQHHHEVTTVLQDLKSKLSVSITDN